MVIRKLDEDLTVRPVPAQVARVSGEHPVVVKLVLGARQADARSYHVALTRRLCDGSSRRFARHDHTKGKCGMFVSEGQVTFCDVLAHVTSQTRGSDETH